MIRAILSVLISASLFFSFIILASGDIDLTILACLLGTASVAGSLFYAETLREEIKRLREQLRLGGRPT